MSDATSGLEELPHAECLALLARAPLGRLAFDHEGQPALVPLNYVLDGETIVIRVAAGSRLARVATGQRCVLEVDDVEPALEAGVSVVAAGAFERVDDAEERARLGQQLQSWAEGERDVILRIRVDDLTGRRIVPLSAGRRAARHHG